MPPCRQAATNLRDMEIKNLKIAVIGGGITGLYLSWKLGKQGHNVSVFERKSEDKAGDKVCSALVSERIRDFIPLGEACVKNKINSCYINFPKKKIRLVFKPSHLALDREMLIRRLIELNRLVGTQIFFNHELKELPKDFDYIIGCDGAGSMVRNSLNLSKPEISLGIRAFADKTDDSNFVFTYPTKSGFCWKIPKSDCLEYGAMGNMKYAKKDFDDFLKKENINNLENLSSAVIPQPKFSFFNAGLVLPDEKNITLCGDACGLTKPWSGGGIIWGLTQADILIKTFPDFKKYRKETIKRFQSTILKGQISKKLIYFAGNYFPFLIPSKITYDNDFPSILESLKSLLKQG